MTDRTNNFPPLPSFLKIKPCFYQNIEEEIPAPHQQLVRKVYILWMMYSGTLCMNVISCLAWWAGGGSATNFGISLLWLVLFSPCSYTCWFRPLYKAFSGWIATVMFFSYNVGSAIVMLITAVLFTLVTMLMGLVLLRVHRLYRGGGGSFERAQEEWSTGAWKSAPVREAGFNAVTQTAQGPSLPQYPTAVPSYPDNSHW
ncbi:secretory carrier-associated membrane protein 4 isoform X3 [Lampris incognitus]|uniref:secretory carrier-associated membrane protein 4 isoform X3 n=1 Tax=Lampris incognitus TaxID=2546036 RepID=UPI0024B54F1B|nr:secretory carrier-associated membrane protein 4 isoform X3 [Lampris incognitus]